MHMRHLLCFSLNASPKQLPTHGAQSYNSFKRAALQSYQLNVSVPTTLPVSRHSSQTSDG